MARTKTTQKKDKDGKHRKETRAERQARLEGQQKAREACEKLLPYAVGAVLVFAILFGLYVRSLPPKVVGTPPKIPKTTTHTVPNTGGGGVPEFMRINTEPKPKPSNNGGGEDAERAALDETMREASGDEPGEVKKEPEAVDL